MPPPARLVALGRLVLALALLSLATGAMPTAHAETFTITGRVVLPEGVVSKSPNSTVYLYLERVGDPQGFARANVAEDGTFAVSLQAGGDYLISVKDYGKRIVEGFFDGSGISADHRDAVPVAAGSELTILARLGSSISGVILPLEGQSFL